LIIGGFLTDFPAGNSEQNDKWLHSSIMDDPVKGSNTRGTISFATAGPNTRSSQVFINYIDNSRLDEMGFAPFGEVIEGLEETAELVHNPTPGDSNGVDQEQYEFLGNDWIRQQYPVINFIQTGSVSTSQP
jgi:peptidyl-prolyl cis-trans isomerase A (cyclophilin A)